MNQELHNAIIRTLRRVQMRFPFLLLHGTGISEIQRPINAAELPVDGPYVGLFLRIDLLNGQDCYHCVMSVSHIDNPLIISPQIEENTANVFIERLSHLDYIITCNAAYVPPGQN